MEKQASVNDKTNKSEGGERKKKTTPRLRHYLDGHLQQDGGGGMCLGRAQIPSLQQRTTTAVKTKTHDPQKQTEGGGEEGNQTGLAKTC